MSVLQYTYLAIVCATLVTLVRGSVLVGVSVDVSMGNVSSSLIALISQFQSGHAAPSSTLSCCSQDFYEIKACFYDSSGSTVVIESDIQVVLRQFNMTILSSPSVGRFCAIEYFFAPHGQRTHRKYLSVSLENFNADTLDQIWTYALMHSAELFDQDDDAIICAPVSVNVSDDNAENLAAVKITTCDVNSGMIMSGSHIKNLIPFFAAKKKLSIDFGQQLTMFFLNELLTNKKATTIISLKSLVFSAGFGSSSFEENLPICDCAKSISYDSKAEISLFPWHVSEQHVANNSMCALNYPADHVEIEINCIDNRKDLKDCGFEMVVELFVEEEKVDSDGLAYYLVASVVYSLEDGTRRPIFNVDPVRAEVSLPNGAMVLRYVGMKFLPINLIGSSLQIELVVFAVYMRSPGHDSNTGKGEETVVELCQLTSIVQPVKPFHAFDSHAVINAAPRGAILMSGQIRDLFGDILLRQLGLNSGVSVEVGVFRGFYSESFLSLWPEGGAHFVVDPWTSNKDYFDLANNWYRSSEIMTEALARLEKFGDRITVLQTNSTDAANLLADRSISFVYIDARHDYYSCMRDMRAWWSTIRPGGVLAGHDWDMQGVQFAVREFAAKMGREVLLTGNYERFPKPINSSDPAYSSSVNNTLEFLKTYQSWFMVK